MSKLTYLNETKEQIKNALNTNFNSQIQDNDTFRSYVSKINNIYNNWPKVTDNNKTVITLNNTKKGKMQINLKGNTNQKTLPNEYTAVDYIQSDGNQYIDTGVYPYKTKTEITFQLLDNYTTQSANKMLGGISGSTRYILAYLYYGYSPQVISPANNSNGILVNIPMDNGKHTLIYNDENNDIIYDNVKQSFISGRELTDLSSVSTKSLTLFAANRSSIDLRSSYKLYGCKITNKDTNTLERNFVPCYRNSDNEIGLYDLVNDIFYVNQGTGNFTYGSSIVSIPNPDYSQTVQVVKGNNNISVNHKNIMNKTIPELESNNLFRTNGGASYEISEDKLIITTKDASLNSGVYILGITNRVDNYDKNAIYNVSFNVKTSVTLDLKYGQTDYNLTSVGTTLTRVNWQGKLVAGTFVIYSTRNHTGDTIEVSNIMISVSDDTTYEPYLPSVIYPVNLGDIELCKIGNYQDYIYKLNNKWYKHNEIYKIILNGTEDWGKTNYAYTLSGLNAKTISNLTNTMAYCDYFYWGNGQTNVFKYASFWYNLQGTGFRFEKDNVPNLDNFKTWLSTHNMTVYYVLATPTDIEITDSTLIGQLNAIERAYSYEGNTNITQLNEDLPFILDVSALKNNSE